MNKNEIIQLFQFHYYCFIGFVTTGHDWCQRGNRQNLPKTWKIREKVRPTDKNVRKSVQNDVRETPETPKRGNQSSQQGLCFLGVM